MLRRMAEIKEIRTQLRIPAVLHERINAAAKDSGRSMNAEIVKRLEESFALGAQASADRIQSVVMISAMSHGAKVEPAAVQKFIQGMIRTTQDADKLREISGALKEASAHVVEQRKKRETSPPAHKKPRARRG